MKNRTKEFYDQLAKDYHLLFADWKESVKRQGLILGRLIRSLGYQPPAALLDCSSGIGAQAIARHSCGRFAIVISCDNALPHLLSDKDLRLATAGIARVLRPGGLFLASIRDYDQLLNERPRVTLPAIHGEKKTRYLSFQEWVWDEKEPIYSP